MSREQKARLQAASLAASGIHLNGLSGLYCHFLAQSHVWMSEGGIAGWLIPREFMDVNYGQAIKRYLLERVTLLHLPCPHRLEPSANNPHCGWAVLHAPDQSCALKDAIWPITHAKWKSPACHDASR